ncbi:MAG: alkaline phosphatase D family protein [Bryobacter sp.]|nr:alkaline phosphatase D family protein [Bryobacter sp.]
MLSRRELSALGLLGPVSSFGQTLANHLATGVKVGELSPTSATVWMRRTKHALRRADGTVRKGHQQAAKYLEAGTPIETLEGSCPGDSGYLRVAYEGRGRSQTSAWIEVGPSTDFAAQATLAALLPATDYRYKIETRAAKQSPVDGELTGSFRTLPSPQDRVPARIALLSCQMYCHMDREDGFHIYESIARSAPNFLLSCGDNVYYDNEDPIANSEAVARYHWDRMYSLPTIRECLRKVGGFWLKDDHDTLSDDAWPAMEGPKMAPFTFAQGQRIFREQVPAPPANRPLYRQVRVGRYLELFLTESRDYRTPNTQADGPAKTIWGSEQKQWLFAALKASEAPFKVLVNPNPLVGPDRTRKNDNHSNAGFRTESLEIRKFLQKEVPGTVIAICGDRHWQYHSVDPETGLHEFCCGAASHLHAGGTPGEDPVRHRFHRVKGGYLELDLQVSARVPSLTVSHHDVLGAKVHSQSLSPK